MKKQIFLLLKKHWAAFSLVFLLVAFTPPQAHAANTVLSLSPSTGSFVVNSTFDVSIYLDTQSQSVNTIQLGLDYPPDKLQLVSSSTGQSIIGLWTNLPQYNNQTGTISLVGGIPGGVNVSQGLITTLTFRVKAIGSAVVKFDNTKILLNDGLGTEVLSQNINSVYNLTLPPPAGPVVASDTDPDQTLWYNNPDADLTWAGDDGATAYSYVLNDLPVDTPPDISEGDVHNVVYHNLADGRHYFHIKSLRNGEWGGVTDYAINVDTTPPAGFQIVINPSARTDHRQPVIQFATTDQDSGLDHYELQIVPLNQPATGSSQEFFIEAESPYVPGNLALGSYDVIVRAFDKAGNVRQETQRMDIVTALFKYVGGQGLVVNSTLVVSWLWLLLVLLAILGVLGYLAYRTRAWHKLVHHRQVNKHLNTQIQQQVSELQQYRAKYGKLGLILLIALSSVFFSAHKSLADSTDTGTVAPPVITTVSKNITNNEIYYVGGRTGVPGSTVVLYLQNTQTTETTSADITTDKNGEWFYRGESFLSAGNYLIWGQTKVGEQLSPPSPQIQLAVVSAALQIGSTSLSYEGIYLTLFLAALLLILILICFIVFHYYHGRRKHRLLMSQITEAQSSVKRGFALLNRDLEAELAVIRKAKLTKDLSMEEKQRERELAADLQKIEQYLDKEIWDIEDTEVRS